MSASANNSSLNATTSAQSETGQPVGSSIQPHLTRRQILVLPVLAIAPNITAAAREVGISDSTLHRWRKNEHFQAELDRLTAEAAERTRQQLENLTVQSTQVLSDLMEDPDPMVRLQAARTATILGIQVNQRRDPKQER